MGVLLVVIGSSTFVGAFRPRPADHSRCQPKIQDVALAINSHPDGGAAGPAGDGSISGFSTIALTVTSGYKAQRPVLPLSWNTFPNEPQVPS